MNSKRDRTHAALLALSAHKAKMRFEKRDAARITYSQRSPLQIEFQRLNTIIYD